ncbi:MAG: hypothetical protein AB1486_22930 [Planctomycetota bacterium]
MHPRLTRFPLSLAAALPLISAMASAQIDPFMNGKRSLLEIRDLLDAQYPQPSDLQSMLNYAKVLELAGLLEL